MHEAKTHLPLKGCLQNNISGITVEEPGWRRRIVQRGLPSKPSFPPEGTGDSGTGGPGIGDSGVANTGAGDSGTDAGVENCTDL